MDEGIRIALEPPSEARVASYLRFIEAMRAGGETVWEAHAPRATETPSDFVARVLRYPREPDEGMVPATTRWAVLDDEVVGRIALRHSLNASLEEFGGHIGYEVHPSHRRRGVATEMIRRLLAFAKARGIDRVLVTCAPDNVGSRRAIVANGGVLARTAFVERLKRETSYYWIALR